MKMKRKKEREREREKFKKKQRKKQRNKERKIERKGKRRKRRSQHMETNILKAENILLLTHEHNMPGRMALMPFSRRKS